LSGFDRQSVYVEMQCGSCGCMAMKGSCLVGVCWIRTLRVEYVSNSEEASDMFTGVAGLSLHRGKSRAGGAMLSCPGAMACWGKP
jgi:hypothetical protein